MPVYPDGSTAKVEDCAMTATPKKCAGFHDAEGEENSEPDKYLNVFVNTNGYVVCRFSGGGQTYSGACRVNVICVEDSFQQSNPPLDDEIYCTRP